MFINSMHFLIFSEEFLKTLIIVLALEIPEIQHFPKFLETMEESPIFDLSDIGTYAKPDSVRYLYRFSISTVLVWKSLFYF